MSIDCDDDDGRLKCQYILCHKIIIFLRAERRRREARREKFTHKNCTLPTIHLGPAGRRPAWAYDDDDDDDDDDNAMIIILMLMMEMEGGKIKRTSEEVGRDA